MLVLTKQPKNRSLYILIIDKQKKLRKLSKFRIEIVISSLIKINFAQFFLNLPQNSNFTLFDF